MQTKLTHSIIGVVLAGLTLLSMASIATADSHDHRTAAAVTNFTGTFGRGLASRRCGDSTTVTDHHQRGIYLSQTASTLSVRSTDVPGTRLIHIESPTHAMSGALRPSGLAHWEGEALIVETRMPAVPMWTDARVPSDATDLVERFELVGSHFEYKASYRRADSTSAIDVVDVLLPKCE